MYSKELINIVTKNQILNVSVNDVTATGDGVAKYDGYPLFIKGGVTGDELEVTVTKTNKSYGFAKINTILVPSPYRAEPICPVYTRCGGCDYMHIDYSCQKELKASTVKNNLIRLGGIDDFVFEGIVSAEDIYNYRNKAQFPIGKSNGQTVCGFYTRKSHEIIPCSFCHIQKDCINRAVEAFLKYANETGISVYNEEKHTGILRHIYVRCGNKTDDMIVVIVTNSRKPFPDTDRLISLIKASGNVKGIVQNINTKRTNLVLGEENRLIWGEEYITSYIGDLKFRISPESFFQVNGEQTQKLYSKALEYAEITEKDTVFDLYCGVGSISLFLAQKAGKVIGVEIVEKAIENAKENAHLNGIDNTEFYAGDCGEVVDRLIKDGKSADVVVVDPPRKGCSPELLGLVNRISPKRVVYVSCNSATLARDAKILEGYGYKLKKACAVDLFPMSGHTEAVASFIK